MLRCIFFVQKIVKISYPLARDRILKNALIRFDPHCLSGVKLNEILKFVGIEIVTNFAY